MTSRQRFLNKKLYKMRFLSLIWCVITLTFLSLVSTPTKASALQEPLPKSRFNYHPSELLARARTIIPTFHSSSRGTANPQRHVSGLWDIFSNVYSVQDFPSSYWRALCPNPERKATTATVLSKAAYNLMGSTKSPEIELGDGKRALHRGFLEKLGVYCWRLGNCGLLARKESSDPITGPTDKEMDSDIPHEVNTNTSVKFLGVVIFAKACTEVVHPFSWTFFLSAHMPNYCVFCNGYRKCVIFSPWCLLGNCLRWKLLIFCCIPFC